MFVSDTGNNRIQLLRTDDGTHMHTFGSKGEEDGNFNYPVGLFLTPDGKMLFVADRNNHRVQLFTNNEIGIIDAEDGGDIVHSNETGPTLPMNASSKPDTHAASSNASNNNVVSPPKSYFRPAGKSSKLAVKSAEAVKKLNASKPATSGGSRKKTKRSRIQTRKHSKK